MSLGLLYPPKFSIGNAIIEYILPGVLLLLLSIGAMSSVGINFQNQMAGLKSDLASRNSNAQNQNSLHLQQKGNFKPQASSLVITTGTSQNGLNFRSSAMASTVQTLGANGTTSMLASQLKALAEKLKADGTITEDGANKIIALANQGFRMADLEKSIEDTSKSVSSNQAFLNASIVFDGKSIPMTQVAGLIGFGTPTDCNQDISSNPGYMLDPTYASPETLSFINLYKAAIADPSLQASPEVQGVISQLSSEISWLCCKF